MAAPRRVCVVVPTYNEKENVLTLIEEINKVRTAETDILFVDDASPDGTGDVLRQLSVAQPWVRVMVRKGKMGIGSAYQDGFREAVANIGAAVLVQMDADLQHPPATMPSLVKAVEEGADVAVASRYVPGGGSKGWSIWRRTVSKGANAYARTLLGLSVKDSTSGYRALTKDAAEILSETKLPAKGFEFQVASLKLLKKMKIVEVPYAFSRRTAGVSKLGMADIIRFFFAVIRIALS